MIVRFDPFEEKWMGTLLFIRCACLFGTQHSLFEPGRTNRNATPPIYEKRTCGQKCFFLKGWQGGGKECEIVVEPKVGEVTISSILGGRVLHVIV